MVDGVLLFDTWVYAKAVADTHPKATVQRASDGKYAVWVWASTDVGAYASDGFYVTEV